MARTTGTSPDCAVVVGGIARQTTMSKMKNGEDGFPINRDSFPPKQKSNRRIL